MFRNIVRARLPIGGRVCSWHRRDLSYISVHSTFPATLYRFQQHRESNLFDRIRDQGDFEREDGVEVDNNDGLVYPKIDLDVSNGALFMPNTHFMQEVTRTSFDRYLESARSGRTDGYPHYLSIPRGTALPSSLTLYRERNSRFTLQPSHPMLLAELNEILTKFYSKSGTEIPAETWLEKHPYDEAYLDHEEDWMAT